MSDDGKKEVHYGDEDEWAARWRLNEKRAPAPQQQTSFLPSFALISAATRGDIEAVRQYAGNVADVRYDDCKALRMAAAGGHHDIVEVLLNAGAYPNALDGAALTSAVEKNDVRMARLLLNHGADPDLHFALCLRRAAHIGAIEVITELVKAGVDLFATPFMPDAIAAQNADQAGKTETAEFLHDVMRQQKEKFLEDMHAAEDCILFMRNPYAGTREPGFVRAVKMGCIDDALARMISSNVAMQDFPLHKLEDRYGRTLQNMAAEWGLAMKLYDPLLWRSQVPAMQESWGRFPHRYFESGVLKRDDFNAIVAGVQQNSLKAKAHKYKI